MDPNRLETLEEDPEEQAEGEAFRWPEDRPGDVRGGILATIRARGRKNLRRLVAVGGVGLGVAIAVLPTPQGLAPEGQASFAVFVICVTLWVTNALPIGVTGLLAVALLALLGGMAPADVYAAFGNSAVFFILGVFILAAALIQSGLSKRLALWFLRRFQRGPYTLAAGIMVTGTFLTCWMPAQATTAMLFPITLEIAQGAKLRQGHSTYGRVLFLSLAWGAMVGSNASILGSSRAPLALGMLSQSFDRSISFAQWLLASAPLVAVGLVIGLLILRFANPREQVDLTDARTAIAESVAALGPIGSRQLRVAAVMVVTIGAWVFLGSHLDRSAIAMVAVVAMFALGVLRWNDLEGYVQWGIVLMYGGAIALGVAIDHTGAAAWLVNQLLGDAKLPAFGVLAGVTIMTVALSEVMSNAAAVAVILPLAFTLAVPAGLSPTVMVFATCFAAGLAFTLPISSEPNTIAYSSGYVRMRDMMYLGSIMTVLQLILLLLAAFLYWPQVGILD